MWNRKVRSASEEDWWDRVMSTFIPRWSSLIKLLYRLLWAIELCQFSWVLDMWAPNHTCKVCWTIKTKSASTSPHYLRIFKRKLKHISSVVYINGFQLEKKMTHSKPQKWRASTWIFFLFFKNHFCCCEFSVFYLLPLMIFFYRVGDWLGLYRNYH